MSYRSAGGDVGAITSLERPDNTLDRVTAGMRAATLNKVLFSDAEVAVILGVSTELLKLWRREGRGPPWKRLGGPGGKLVRYHIDDLHLFAATLPREVAPPVTMKEQQR
jgi:hypothetical protein